MIWRTKNSTPTKAEKAEEIVVEIETEEEETATEATEEKAEEANLAKENPEETVAT